MEIKYFNRHSEQYEYEKVYGDKAVEWLYNSTSGKMMSKALVQAPLSQFYGWLQGTHWSKSKVGPFIQNFNIPIEDFVPEEGRNIEDPYSSFNKFFIRKFKKGKRGFVEGQAFPAPAEARYFGYKSMTKDIEIPVKGKFMSAAGLIENDKWAEIFHEGPLLLARLCPVDYHRYHYPDNGETLDSYRVGGVFHSVNPLALKRKPDIFLINERQVSILKTENFGRLAYIEVGAMCVGKIVQSHQERTFKRADEKGYFLFGGSTVIILGEKGLWSPSEDILKNTKEGIETYLQLGSQSGLSIGS